MANRLLYTAPKDMRKSFKLGFGNGKRTLAMLLVLAGTLNPAKLHAEEKRSTVARLQIQVIVVPTVIASQQAQRPGMQPSQTAISFDLSPNTKQNGSYSTQNVTVTEPHGTAQAAVLKTMTMVSE